MNELMTLVNTDISGWLCSGSDQEVMTGLFQNLLFRSAARGQIQVVIAAEDMAGGLCRIVESDYRNIGYLPSPSCGYFPAFEGKHTDLGERLQELLGLSRMEEGRADEIMAYLDFLMELDGRFGAERQGKEALLWEYAHASDVERVLNQAAQNGELGPEEYEDWIADYSACSAGRIHLNRFLDRLDRCFYLKAVQRQAISCLGNGERLCFIIRPDMGADLKKILFRLIGWDILETRRNGKEVGLFILEGSQKYGSELTELLKMSPSSGANFFSADFFAGHSEDWKEAMDSCFHNYIYTAHSRMESCEEISSRRFGQVPIVRNSYSCDRDRRIRSNRILDRLLNTNRVDHYIRHVPVWEPQYRKEEIFGMPRGTCLVQTDSFCGFADLKM